MKLIDNSKPEMLFCTECGMFDKNLMSFSSDVICLDCLDKALKTIIHAPKMNLADNDIITFNND